MLILAAYSVLCFWQRQAEKLFHLTLIVKEKKKPQNKKKNEKNALQLKHTRQRELLLPSGKKSQTHKTRAAEL